MSMLQEESSSSPAEAWKKVMMMTKNLAAQEIIRERREAIESGKFKGRRLFQPMEEGESDMGGPGREVRSLFFYYSESEDESSGSKGFLDCTRGCSYSSSISSSSSPLDKDQEVKRVAEILATAADTRVAIGRPGNGRRYAVFLCGLAIALLITAICMSLASSGGFDYEMVLTPT